MNYLPDGYEYKLIENADGRLTFRIKDIYDKEAISAWLTAYKEKSKYTWRISRTYPNAGKIYSFHGDYRCHHNTDSRSRRICKRITKHTGCEATMKIRLKRYMEKTKSKFPDTDAKEYPCIVTLRNEHNHSQFAPEVLRFRDISVETKNKLLSYFMQGFSASKARRALETDLMMNEEDFEAARVDASKLPTVSVIAHLFNRFLTTVCSAKGVEFTNDMKAPSSESDQNHSDYEPDSHPGSPIGQESDESLMEINFEYEEAKNKRLPSLLETNTTQNIEEIKTSQSDEDYLKELLAKHRRDLFSEVDDDMNSNTFTFDVLDCDSQKMQRLLRLYSGKTRTLDQRNMLILYYFANKYDMKLLKEECCDFIRESLSVTNICEVVQLALNHSDSKLLDSAIEYFSNNSLDILNSLEWQSFLEYNPTAANNLLIKYFEKSKS